MEPASFSYAVKIWRMLGSRSLTWSKGALGAIADMVEERLPSFLALRWVCPCRGAREQAEGLKGALKPHTPVDIHGDHLL